MKKMMMLIGAALFGAVQAWGATVECSAWAQVKSNLEAGNSVKLTAHVSQSSTGGAVISGKTVTLDLNGYTITASSQTGETYRPFTLANSAILTLTDGSAASTGKIDGDSVSRAINGGCVYVNSGCTFAMNSGTITKFVLAKNTTSKYSGGAVYCLGTMNVTGGTITNCTAVYGEGGALYVSGGTVTMSDGKITGNESKGDTGLTGNGGGVAVRNSGIFTLSGGDVSNNTSTRNGGGFALLNATLTITGGTISRNTSPQGGAIQSDASTATVYGGLFSGNTDNLIWLMNKGSATIYGAVADTSSIDTYKESGKECTKVGTNYIVGTGIVSDASNKLIAGTYTFNPMNADYAAAGLSLGEDHGVSEKATNPKTWTVISEVPVVMVTTLAELKAAICDAGVSVIEVAADIDIPCESSAAHMTTTAALLVERNLTIQGKNGIPYRLRRTGNSSNFNRSILEIYGDGTYDNIAVTLKDITFDGGAVWAAGSTPQTRWTNKGKNYDIDHYGKSSQNSGVAGRGMIDVANKATLNIESGVTIQNGDCSCSAQTRTADLTTPSGANCYGAGIRVECYYSIGGGTVNLKMGALVQDCTGSGFGGGIGAYNLARLNVYGGTLLRCSGSHGGGIGVTRASYAYGTGGGKTETHAGVISLSNATFDDCWAQYGAAINIDAKATECSTDPYYQYSRVTGMTVTNCTASVGGAAIMIGKGTETEVFLANSPAVKVYDSSGNGNYTSQGYTVASGIYREQGTETINAIAATIRTVTFVADGATYGQVQVEDGHSCGAMFPADPQSAGAIFLGWFKGETQYTAETIITEDTVLTAKWGGVTVAIPAVAHTTVTNVTVNGEMVQVKNGVVVVLEDSEVEVFYKADIGYILAGDTTATITDVAEDHKTIDTSKVTVEPLVQVGDDAWARIKGGVCTITGTSSTWDFTNKDNPLDASWESITNVVVADGVTGLGAYMFHKFYNITNMTLASSVTNLATGSIFLCHSLRSVSFLGTAVPTMETNVLNLKAGIVMDGDKPVVTLVPDVKVNGKSPTLQGSNDLKTWVLVTKENVKQYHFFRYVVQ